MMKIYFCLVIMLIGFVFNVSAQTTVKLDAERLFEEAAELVLTSKNLNPYQVNLKEYGRRAAGSISNGVTQEEEAAILLLELQGNDPINVIKNQIAIGRNSYYTTELRADILTIEYLKVLVAYCSRSKTDLLKQKIDVIEGSSGRELLDKELKKELKKIEPEESFAKRLIEAKKQVEEIGLGNLKVQDWKGRGLFFPLCLLFRKC